MVVKENNLLCQDLVQTKYRSVANATAEIMWIQSLLDELQIKSDTKTIIYCYNLSTVQLTANLVLHSRMKHMESDLYFV